MASELKNEITDINGCKISEFKGKKVITLNPDGQFPFTFGVGKAKLILECFEDIEKFVELFGNS